jgi:Zn-finger nucleic acid-binding protein
LNIEDIEFVSKKVRDLYQSVREGNINSVADIQSKVQDIRRLAIEKEVPIFIDEKELIKIMQTSEIGVPEEYEEEESSESEEYEPEEEDDEETDKED